MTDINKVLAEKDMLRREIDVLTMEKDSWEQDRANMEGMIAKLEEKSKWRSQRQTRNLRVEGLKKLNSSALLLSKASLKGKTTDAERIQVLLDENEK